MHDDLNFLGTAQEEWGIVDPDVSDELEVKAERANYKLVSWEEVERVFFNK